MSGAISAQLSQRTSKSSWSTVAVVIGNAPAGRVRGGYNTARSVHYFNLSFLGRRSLMFARLRIHGCIYAQSVVDVARGAMEPQRLAHGTGHGRARPVFPAALVRGRQGLYKR